MKYLALLALLFAGLANAETINLTTTNCGATRYCTTVYNDVDAGITVNAKTGQASVGVYLDGVLYSSPFGNAPDTLRQLVYITDLTLTADDGSAIVLNAAFYGVRKLTGSGRGQHWTTAWQLLDGSIER